MIDDLIIDSKWCEDVSPKGLIYEDSYLETGAPRCDILYGDGSEPKRTFREKHGLPDNAKVVMFAPTFREGSKDGKRSVYSEVWTIDFKRMLDNLEKKFGGPMYICVRVHPQLAPAFGEYQNPEVQDRIINESQADDMYEILAGMDAYITNYSSACFEAGFVRIPVFIYADDIEKYARDRGALMMRNLATDPQDNIRNNKDITPRFDVRFPFGVASDNDELEKLILEFDNDSYCDRLDKLFEELGLVFEGNASKRVAEKVRRVTGI